MSPAAQAQPNTMITPSTASRLAAHAQSHAQCSPPAGRRRRGRRRCASRRDPRPDAGCPPVGRGERHARRWTTQFTSNTPRIRGRLRRHPRRRPQLARLELPDIPSNKPDLLIPKSGGGRRRSATKPRLTSGLCLSASRRTPLSARAFRGRPASAERGVACQIEREEVRLNDTDHGLHRPAVAQKRLASDTVTRRVSHWATSAAMVRLPLRHAPTRNEVSAERLVVLCCSPTRRTRRTASHDPQGCKHEAKSGRLGSLGETAAMPKRPRPIGSELADPLSAS
jgi:hypothetical protein